ncbi:preprotein translocase subunit SecG [Nitrospinae bacterium AH_259_B05_G02_I21]|nr:preprotein translocase subunit SecG [Nitrospinae bacterium AH_259_B05_G02_I21]
MLTIILVLHIIVSFALIAIVLLQTGKGASMGAAFGGSSQTVFGSRGPASFLHKLTTAAAVIFMLTSFGLSIYKARQERASIVTSQTQPLVPPPSPPSQAPAGR